jgi:glycosyltransferase involved in cell wall biosynthesis
MLPEFVLVTPARNEARFIGLTIESVVNQTVRPLMWVIVSDGSTDDTDKIVARYAVDYPWIQLVRMPERRERHFAGKVQAFNAGYARVRHLSFDVIGSLDADLSFEPGYFAFLLGKLAQDPELGLVGTPFADRGKQTYDYRFVNIEHVSGACQLFRRKCFEDIGGYTPVKAGGIDYIAVVTARMKGWKTRTFTEKISIHHREMGTAQHGILGASFKLGVKDYLLGNHPIWQMSRILYQMTKRPYLVGASALAAGYAWAKFSGSERTISSELVSFVRREQMRRLRAFFTAKKSRRERVVA